MRGEAHASLENALEVLLSRTSLDLGPRVSHHTSNHPIETGQLSLLHCLMWVDFTETGDTRGRACGAPPGTLVQCREGGPDVMEGHPTDDGPLGGNAS